MIISTNIFLYNNNLLFFFSDNIKLLLKILTINECDFPFDSIKKNLYKIHCIYVIII